ncbi:MAG: hypothetical protein COB36_06250 [Alphaproteobacteria bacterium]|nr:MAG: hypothetical protein COB36_06250 [Alphaproteobacteria bacterium]
MAQANGDVAPLQRFLIDNLEALNKIDGFDLKATDIGNSQGQPDDLLGKNTGTALQTLVLMAQLNAGISPEDATTSYNDDTRKMLEDYLTNELKLDPAATAQFIADTEVISTGSRLAQDYQSSASVETSALTSFADSMDNDDVTADVIIVEQNVAAEDNTETIDYISAADSIIPIDESLAGMTPRQNDITSVSQQIALSGLETSIITTTFLDSVTSTISDNTVGMTPDDYENLQDKITDNLASDQETLVAAAYSATLLNKQNELGYGQAKAELTDATSALQNYGTRSRELYQEIGEFKDTLENFQVSGADGETHHINDEPMTLTFEDGSTKTMTYNEFDDAANNWYDFLGLEGDDQQKLRNAMDIAYADLKESSGYNAVENDMIARQEDSRTLYTDLINQNSEAHKTVAAIEKVLDDTTLDVAVPEGVTDQQLANIIPSYEASAVETGTELLAENHVSTAPAGA